METPTRIIVASSELENRRGLVAILEKEGYDVVCASRASECKEVLETQKVAAVFCDRRLTDGSYREVVAAAGSTQSRVRVVVTSRLADWNEYLEALHYGAFDLIASPCRYPDVLWTILRARREELEPVSSLATAVTAHTGAQRHPAA